MHIEPLAGTAAIESFVLTSENKAHTGIGPSFATAYKSNEKKWKSYDKEKTRKKAF